MKALWRLKTAVLGVVIAILISSSSAWAAYIFTCEGTPIVRKLPVVLRAHSESFEHIAWSNSLQRMVDLWNEGPSNYLIELRFNDSDVHFNNGQNEVWFSDDQEILGELLALTTRVHCGEGGKETDVVFDSTRSWLATHNSGTTSGVCFWELYPYGGSDTVIFFDDVAVHEIGHTVPLFHEHRYYNVMGAGRHYHTENLLPSVCSVLATVYPGVDASNGAIYLYGTQTTPVSDVSISHWKWISDSSLYVDTDEYSVHGRTEVFDLWGNLLDSYPSRPQDPPTDRDPRMYERTYWVHNGEPINVEFTYENTGSVSHDNVDLNFFLSRTRSSPWVRELFPIPYGIHFPAISMAILTHRINLPADLSADEVYYILPWLDVLDNIPESNNTNNGTYVRIHVAPSEIKEIALSPDMIVGSGTASGHIELTGKPHPGLNEVRLHSNYPDIATVPDSLVIPDGDFSGNFSISVKPPLCGTRSVTITASYDYGTGVSEKSAQLKVIALIRDSTEEQAIIKVGMCGGIRIELARGMLYGDAIAEIIHCKFSQNCGMIPEGCRNCINTFSGQSVDIPTHLMEVRRSVTDLLSGKIDSNSWYSHINKLANHFKKAPRGQYYNKQLQKSAIKMLQGIDKIEKFTLEQANVLAELTNAIELDVRVPSKVLKPKRDKKFDRLNFDEVATLRRIDDHTPSGARLHIEAGLPSPSTNFIPVWPVSHYNFELLLGSNNKDMYEIGINLRGFNFTGDGSLLRVFEWDGHDYSDVTGQLDLVDGVIYAQTEKVATYVIGSIPISVVETVSRKQEE